MHVVADPVIPTYTNLPLRSLICYPGLYFLSLIMSWKFYTFTTYIEGEYFQKSFSQLQQPVLQPVQLRRPPHCNPTFSPSIALLCCSNTSTPLHPCIWPPWTALQRIALQRTALQWTAILQWSSNLRLHRLAHPCLQHPCLCPCRGGGGVDNWQDQLFTNVPPSIVGVD